MVCVGGGVVLFELRGVELGVRLCGVTLRIDAGVTAILGYSGAGKTSLLSVLAGFERPTAGCIERGEQSAGGALPCYWVPQSGGLWSHVSVRGHVELVSAGKADEILRLFDLWDRRDSYPGELSQGERSRLSVVRAVSAGARVLLMDEPLAHVDPVRKPGYWRQLERQLRGCGVSLVFSCHEPGVVLRHAERVVCLREGRVWYEGGVLELYERAPEQALGEFLGPLNWLDERLLGALGVCDGRLLEAVRRRGGVCMRPEWLCLRGVVESAGAVEQSVGVRSAVGGCVSGGWVSGGVLEVVSSRVAGGLQETVVAGAGGGEWRLLHGGAGGAGAGGAGVWRAGERVRAELFVAEGGRI